MIPIGHTPISQPSRRRIIFLPQPQFFDAHFELGSEIRRADGGWFGPIGVSALAGHRRELYSHSHVPVL
jgi:hypothetical protein